jgi:A/G-specific adenine glycosylase
VTASQERNFSDGLLRWFDVAGRKHLPWQQDRTPYRVWISEIMLQQTQVNTVIPYYQRFMEKFPSVEALARAPLDEVLHLWTGLGYYARARHLHRSAQLICQQHHGQLPRDHAQLHALPGIGRSTAGAILALSWNDPHPILDGNVKRVLTRVFAIHGYPGDAKIEAQLWQLAERCTPTLRVADYTQAMMDLGATLCSRRQPQCPSCPLISMCQAQQLSLQSVLPTTKPKRVRLQRREVAIVLVSPQGRVLLEQRPLSGIWGGLWACPQFTDLSSAHAWIYQQLGRMSVDGLIALPLIEHAFTHFDLQLQPYVFKLEEERLAIAETDRYRWFDPKHPDQIGLPKPLLSIVQLLNDVN